MLKDLLLSAACLCHQKCEPAGRTHHSAASDVSNVEKSWILWHHQYIPQGSLLKPRPELTTCQYLKVGLGWRRRTLCGLLWPVNQINTWLFYTWAVAKRFHWPDQIYIMIVHKIQHILGFVDNRITLTMRLCTYIYLIKAHFWLIRKS